MPVRVIFACGLWLGPVGKQLYGAEYRCERWVHDGVVHHPLCSFAIHGTIVFVYNVESTHIEIEMVNRACTALARMKTSFPF